MGALKRAATLGSAAAPSRNLPPPNRLVPLASALVVGHHFAHLPELIFIISLMVLIKVKVDTIDIINCTY